MLHKDIRVPSGNIGPVAADKLLAPGYDLEFTLTGLDNYWHSFCGRSIRL